MFSLCANFSGLACSVLANMAEMVWQQAHHQVAGAGAVQVAETSLGRTELAHGLWLAESNVKTTTVENEQHIALASQEDGRSADVFANQSTMVGMGAYIGTFGSDFLRYEQF